MAEVYSELNGVLALGNDVSPLRPIAREAPAIADDVQENFQTLNQDAQGIAQQLLDVENSAAGLYKLFTSSQNNLRQMIREQLYQPSQRRYSEEFINSKRLDAQTSARIDYNAGVATAPLLKETAVIPDSAKTGVASVGSSTTDIGLLLDGLAETALVWTGSQVELVFTFNSPQIVNRVSISLPAHQGLTVVEFTSSPDGVLREDLLADLPAENGSVDGSAGKYSGDWIADFDPRSVQQLRIVLADFVGSPRITIRDVSFSQRTFGNSATAQSLRIAAPQGTVLFRAEQHFAATLTSISHQMSTDGVHYTAIVPGQQLAVGNGGFWYRASMQRLDANFDQAASPLDLSSEDPTIDPAAAVANIVTVDLGHGILERTINLTAVSGTITLNETPLAGTLAVYQGTVALAPPAYMVSGNAIALQPLQRITLRYQTSSYANAGLSARKNYFTPYLYGVFVRTDLKHPYYSISEATWRISYKMETRAAAPYSWRRWPSCRRKGSPCWTAWRRRVSIRCAGSSRI